MNDGNEPEVTNTNNDPQEDLSLSSLLEGDWPGMAKGEPAPEPSDVTPEPEPELEAKPEPEPEPQPEPELKPEPAKDEPKLYKYRGKEYTAEQLIAQGLLEDALTSAEQMPHYQKKYETLLEQQRATPPEAAQAQPQAAPRITPEQVVSHYTPIAEQAVNEGWIEPEMVTVFPKFTTNMMYFRDVILQLQNMVGVLAGREQQRDLSGMKERVDNFIDNTCVSLAGKAKHFELLKDDAVRSGFREHLYKMDPKVEAVNEDFIKTQWLAYNSDALLEALRVTNTQTKTDQDNKRRMAQGESAASPRATTPTVDPTHIDTLLEGDFPSGG